MQQHSLGPRVFIMSSTEGEPVAKKLGEELEKRNVCRATLWTHEFASSRKTIDQLLNQLHTHDFSVVVFSPDVMSTRDNKTQQTPCDNVMVEIGLSLGLLGMDRALGVRVQDVPMPSDLHGMTWQPVAGVDDASGISNAVSKFETHIHRVGVRYGDFVVCIPTGSEDDQEFNHSLKSWLLHQLNEKGIKLIDQGPRGKSEDVLNEFRTAIMKISELQPQPRYLLVLWPLIHERQDKRFVLDCLESLAAAGCRIAFMNEFPKIAPRLYPCLHAGKIFIRGNAEDATTHVVGFVKNILDPQHHVLLVNADQQYITAKDRKEKYEAKLHWLNERLWSVEIDSWDEEDARKKVADQLRDDHGKKKYGVIIAANDRMALGAESAILKAPEPIAKDCAYTHVIGYDGLESAKRNIRSNGGRLAATIGVTPRMYAETAVNELLNFKARKAPYEIPVNRKLLVTRDNLPDKKMTQQEKGSS